MKCVSVHTAIKVLVAWINIVHTAIVKPYTVCVLYKLDMYIDVWSI